MTIARTRAYCNACATYHPAEVVRNNGSIRAVMHCPEGDRDYLISSDPELYLKLRERCFVDPSAPPPKHRHNVLNYISITNGCNFNCTICGANARRDLNEAVFLSVDEICRRAGRARECGARILHLMGGEPTLHPDLIEIVRRLADMGLSVGLVTNGAVIGSDAQLASNLRRNGLSRVCLQFDSFREDILENYARNCLDIKQKAIRHISGAGLKLGLNATVTRQNLAELSRLLEHGLTECSTVVNMTFASAAPVGRYLMDQGESTDRETMVRGLLEAGDSFHFSLDDILPLISYPAWGLDIHPDCGVHIVFARTPKGIFPLNRYFDLWTVYRRLYENRMRPSFWSKRVVPFLYLLGAVRPGRRADALQLVTGLLLRRDIWSVVNVGVSDYRASLFLDEQRIARCASAFHTSQGAVPGCMHYFTDEKYAGSREYEFAHGQC